MQSKNPFLSDLSSLITNAFGVAQNARVEMDTAIKSILDRWLADRDFVSRDEFEAIKLMCQKVREENKELVEKLEFLQESVQNIGNTAGSKVSRKGTSKKTD